MVPIEYKTFSKGTSSPIISLFLFQDMNAKEKFKNSRVDIAV